MLTDKQNKMAEEIIKRKNSSKDRQETFGHISITNVHNAKQNWDVLRKTSNINQNWEKRSQNEDYQQVN